MSEHGRARWETFAHDADWGVRGIGPDREAAFAQAALALTGIVTDPTQVEPRDAVDIECEAPDDELLLVQWLNALAYEMDTRRMLFSRFDVTIRGDHLTARAFGEALDLRRHRPVVEVKGATCTELAVSHGEDGDWRAQCVVDV